MQSAPKSIAEIRKELSLARKLPVEREAVLFMHLETHPELTWTDLLETIDLGGYSAEHAASSLRLRISTLARKPIKFNIDRSHWEQMLRDMSIDPAGRASGPTAWMRVRSDNDGTPS